MIRRHFVLAVLGLTSAVAGCQKQALVPDGPRDKAAPALSVPPVKDTPAVPSTDCLVDEFGIRQKVLIVERGVRCRASAPAGGLVGDPTRFYWPYFLHAVQKVGEDVWYQIGETPRKDSIKGWVSASVAASWPTRLGGEYALGYPLLIYASRDELIELIRTGSTKGKPLARAVPSGRRKWMPWPIAENYLFDHGGKTYELVRLLFLGEYREGGSLAQEERGGGKEGYSDADFARIRAGVQKLDVVFVVDNTMSTTPYTQAIVTAVQSIARELKRSELRPDVTYGLVLYRDHVASILFRDNDGAGSVVKVFPFQSDLDAFIKTVAPLKAAEQSSEDWPEAVYEGVEAGLTRLSWRDTLSERVMILIGDSSGHEPGHPKNPRNVSAEGLIERAGRDRVRIFTLAVPGGPKEDQVKQKEQYGKLARATRGRSYDLKDAGKVAEHINGILRNRVGVVTARGKYIDLRRQGKSDEQIARDSHLDERQRCEVVEFLRSAGIDPARLGSRVPTFATGWCMVEVRGRALIEKKVFVARAELDLLMANLNALNARLRAPRGVRQALELAVASREGSELFVAGGAAESSGETMDIFLRKKRIPSHHGLLRLTRAEIEHMPEERRALLAERLSKQVLPSLMNARNDDRAFVYLNDQEWGWIKESLFP